MLQGEKRKTASAQMLHAFLCQRECKKMHPETKQNKGKPTNKQQLCRRCKPVLCVCVGVEEPSQSPFRQDVFNNPSLLVEGKKTGAFKFFFWEKGTLNNKTKNKNKKEANSHVKICKLFRTPISLPFSSLSLSLCFSLHFFFIENCANRKRVQSTKVQKDGKGEGSQEKKGEKQLDIGGAVSRTDFARCLSGFVNRSP